MFTLHRLCHSVTKHCERVFCVCTVNVKNTLMNEGGGEWMLLFYPKTEKQLLLVQIRDSCTEQSKVVRLTLQVNLAVGRGVLFPLAFILLILKQGQGLNVITFIT